MDEHGCAPMDYLQNQVAEPLSMLSTARREQFPTALVSSSSRREMAGKIHTTLSFVSLALNILEIFLPQRNKEERKLLLFYLSPFEWLPFERECFVFPLLGLEVEMS